LASKSQKKKGQTDLHKLVMDQFTQHTSALSKKYGYYAEGEAFNDGDHFVAYSRSQNQLIPYPRDQYSGPRQVWNACGVVNKLITNAAAQKIPTPMAVAAPMEGRQERLAAETVTGLMKLLFARQGWQDEIRQFIGGAVRLADYAIGVFVDPTEGEIVTDPDNGESKRLGFPGVRAIYPTQILTPFGYTDRRIYKAPWIIVYHVMRIEEINAQYGTDYEEGDGDLSIDSGGEWKYLSRNNQERPYDTDQAPSLTLSKYVIEYWEKPSKAHPRGRYLVATREDSLLEGDLPLEWCIERKRLPFTWLSYQRRGRVLRGMAATHTLRTVNFYLNILMNNNWTSAHQQSIPTIMMQKSAGANEDAFRDPKKQFLYFSSGVNFEPKILQYPNNATTTSAAIDMAQGLIQQVSGINEVMMGNNPDLVRGLGHIAFLHQMASMYFDDFGADRREAIRELGEMVLWTLLELCDDEAGDNLVGPLGFAGWNIIKEMASRPDFNLEIKETSGLFELPLIRRQQIMEEFQMGRYGPMDTPQAIRKFNEALGFNEPDEMEYDEKIDRTVAEIENLKFEQFAAGELTPDEFPVVDEYNDHEIHVRCHARHGKELLAQLASGRLSGEARQVAEQALIINKQHVGDHEMLVQGQQQPITPPEMMARMGGQLPIGMDIGAGGGMPMEQPPPEQMSPEAYPPAAEPPATEETNIQEMTGG
jgi:hypothetical protein